MSVETVRDAVVAFLDSPPIAGVGTVFRGEPIRVVGGDYDPATTIAAGATAVLFVHFNDRTESRLTMPVETGSKETVYHAVLGMSYVFVASASTTLDGWTVPFDQTIDAVVTRLRSDPTFGTGPGGAIYQAGEDKNDIAIHWSEPKRDKSKIRAWAAIDFTIREIVTA